MFQFIKKILFKLSEKNITPNININFPQAIRKIELYSVSPKVIKRHLTVKYEKIMLKYWDEWGNWGSVKFQEDLPNLMGSKYELLQEDINNNLLDKTPWGDEVKEFNYNDVSRYVQLILTNKFNVDLAVKKKYLKNCKICNKEFNSYKISPTFLNFSPKKWDVCLDCTKKCFYQGPKLNKKDMVKPLKDLYSVLGDLIPPNNFKAPSTIKDYITPENHFELMKVFLTLPDYSRYKIKFGSYFKALIEANILEGNSRKTTRGTHCLANDGHECLSISEKIVDDWLYKNKIKHQKEPKYPKDAELNPNELLRGDWQIPDTNIIIEFFGLRGNEDYDNKIIIKKELIKKYDLTLIEIYHEDLKYLSKKLSCLIR